MVPGRPTSLPVTSPSRRPDVPRPGTRRCVGVLAMSAARGRLARPGYEHGRIVHRDSRAKAEGVLTRLSFLVQEGQIRADAVVRHARPGVGLGLKFTALSEQDRPKLAALLTRLRGTHHSHGKS